MTKDNESSESLVDLCVDGEGSAEDWSRLERLLETDEETRREYESATRIRDLFREAATSANPPAALSARVRAAIDSSDRWGNRSTKSARPSRRFDVGAASRSRKTGFVAAAALVAFLAGAVGSDVVSRSRCPEFVVANNVVWTRLDVAEKLTPESILDASSPSAPALDAPCVRMPAANGDSPASTAKSDSDAAFWAEYAVKPGVAAEFSRFCASTLKIDYAKENGDSVFRLKQISPEQWRAVDEWLAEKVGAEGASENVSETGAGSKKASRATVDWANAAADVAAASEPRDVRVELRVVETTETAD